MSNPQPPAARWKYLLLATAISAVLSSVLVFINRQYLFHTVLYENGDPGFNSLAVLRAERFHQIYGAYSRWNLHHPGPALFYWFGWMEELCYRGLGLLPTPFNAQVLAAIILNASFLAGAICCAARWVGSRFFLPLTLLLAVLHYTSVGPNYCLTSTWPPYTMPLIFLALMLAAASVGAGQGDDLPLLVIAGSFAVHSALSQPLFVVPLAVFGYLGLTLSCLRVARAARSAELAAGSTPGPTRAISAWPWRQFPRAHVFAAGLLFVFVLPLLADLCQGTNSNLFLAFHNLPKDASKHHPWLACLYYFLRFGTYKPSVPGAEYYFAGHATTAEMAQFCLAHPKMMTLWLAAIFSPLLALIVHRWFRPVADLSLLRAAKTDSDAAAGNHWPVNGNGESGRRQRWRFLRWLGACWLLTMGLLLCAAHLLATEMAYYESWYCYSIWFVLGMIGTASLSDLLETCAAYTANKWIWVTAVTAISFGAIGWTVYDARERFVEPSFADIASVTQGAVIKETLAAQASGARLKILSFPETAREAASGVAVLLERLGYQARVEPTELNWFGPDFATPDLLDGLGLGAGTAPFDIWRIAPMGEKPASEASRPLIQGYDLILGHPEINPDAGGQITYTGDQPNYDDFALFGWMPSARNAPFIWSEGRLGLICFHPRPIPAGAAVEVAFDCFPLLAKGIVDVQRVDVGMNDDQIGTLHLDQGVPDPMPRLLIPAAVWNRRSLAILTLRFRDAISPEELHENDDKRKLAIGTRKISFRTVQVQLVPATAGL